MKRMLVAFMVLAALISLSPQEGKAIPAFARKYGFNCNMCHVSFTRLNDFGQRFRLNGYQVPGQQGLEKNVFETPPPIAFRITTGLQAAHSRDANTSGFNIFGFDLLTAGVLHKDISYLVIYTPRVDEPGGDYRGETPSQTGALESANLIFSNLLTDALNLRIGKFEPAYHTVSSKRSYYIIQPYEVYAFKSPSGYIFEDNQMGFEVSGHFRNGFRYGAGVVNGNGANPDNNKFKDLYLALSQVIGRGEGQSAGQRIDVFGYQGWQPTIFPPDYQAAAGGELEGHGNKKLMRLGGDISLNIPSFNLTALLMQGNDNRPFNFADSTKDYKFTGGFVELDYYGFMNNRLLISGMYNWVEPPDGDEGSKITAISGVVRYYLGDWTAVNVALHGEYTHRQEGKDDPFKEDIFTALVDFDF
jgi:hypothetical protein